MGAGTEPRIGRFAIIWNRSIEMLGALKFPFEKNPLDPPFSTEELSGTDVVPLFQKEGSGEILDNREHS